MVDIEGLTFSLGDEEDLNQWIVLKGWPPLVSRLGEDGLPTGDPVPLNVDFLPRSVIKSDRLDALLDEYTGSAISLARRYLRPGEPAPRGVEVEVGPRGGRYYEVGPTPQALTPLPVFPDPTPEADEDYYRSVEELGEAVSALSSAVGFDRTKSAIEIFGSRESSNTLARMFYLGHPDAKRWAEEIKEALGEPPETETDSEMFFRTRTLFSMTGAYNDAGFRFLYRLPSMPDGIAFQSMSDVVAVISNSPDFNIEDWMVDSLSVSVRDHVIPTLVHKDDVIATGLPFRGGIMFAYSNPSRHVLSESETKDLIEELGVDLDEKYVPQMGAYLGYAKAIAESGTEGIRGILSMASEYLYADNDEIARIERGIRQKYSPIVSPISWPDDADEIPPFNSINGRPTVESSFLAEARRRGIAAQMKIGWSDVYLEGEERELDTSEFSNPDTYDNYRDPVPMSETPDNNGRRNLSFKDHMHRVMKEFQRLQERFPAARIVMREIASGIPRDGAREAAYTNSEGGRAMILLARDWGRTSSAGGYHPTGASERVEDVFRHEFGHVMDVKISREFADIMAKEFGAGNADQFFDRWDIGYETLSAKKEFSRKFGEYGLANRREMWAECFAVYTNENYGVDPNIPRLPEAAEKFIEDLMARPYLPIWTGSNYRTKDRLKGRAALPDSIGTIEK